MECTDGLVCWLIDFISPMFTGLGASKKEQKGPWSPGLVRREEGAGEGEGGAGRKKEGREEKRRGITQDWGPWRGLHW